MKALIIFLTIFSLAKAQDDSEGCQICRDAMMVFYNASLTEESLDFQKELLNDTVCPYAPDPLGCEEGVITWWDMVAEALFDEEAAAHVCHSLDSSCTLGNFTFYDDEAEQNLKKHWNCGQCVQHFEHVAHLYLNEAAQNDIIGALSGEKLCMDEELALDDDQLAFCQEVMEAFMPPALDVLFKELEHAAHSVCHDLYDICPH